MNESGDMQVLKWRDETGNPGSRPETAGAKTMDLGTTEQCFPRV